MALRRWARIHEYPAAAHTIRVFVARQRIRLSAMAAPPT